MASFSERSIRRKNLEFLAPEKKCCNMSENINEQINNWLEDNYSETDSLSSNVLRVQESFSLDGDSAKRAINEWLSDKGD